MLNKDGLEEICPFSLRGFDAQRGKHVKKFVIKVIQQNSKHLKIAAKFRNSSQKNAVENQVVNRHEFQGSFNR